MRKILFAILSTTLLIACDKGGNPTDITVQLNEAFTLQVDQTATLDADGMKILLMGVPEDSRCPNNAECFVAGNVVVELKIWKGDEVLIKSLTDNPELDPTLSTEIEVFGHLVKLVEVTPYPETFDDIKQSEYRVKLEIE